MIRKHAFMILMGLAALAQPSVAVLAQDSEVLTNADLMKMAAAGLSEDLVVTVIKSSPSFKFDLSPESLIALQKAGVTEAVVQVMIAKARPASSIPVTSVNSPEKSDVLDSAKSNETILRSFKTLSVNASQAKFFNDQDMKAALGKNKDFQRLNIVVVDDKRVADVVLEVAYTFAWDYPFSLKYQNSTAVLVAGKGAGPFSGPAGAASVAKQLAKVLKPYRQPPPAPKK